MIVMKWKLLRWLRPVTLAGGIALLATRPVTAQTAENTVITNTAEVNWTDGNSNTYTPVSQSVAITVGFQAGIDVIAAAATVTPASPSTADTLSFDVLAIGNGTDSVTISESISVGGIITVTGYRLGGTTYGSLATLNGTLSALAIAQGDTITIKVVYDVSTGAGGLSTVYTMTAASRRTPSVTDSDVTTITPGLSFAVAVTPDGGQNLQQLPSNGTNYTFTFTVQNNGNGAEDFDLLASFVDVSDIAIVSVNGVAGDSARINLASGASTTIDVIYSVLNVAAGTRDTVSLRSRSVTSPATFDDAFADLTVIRPAITIAKAAYLDDQVTVIAGGVLPNEFIQYKITVTNAGDADASSVHVDDLLPAEVTFVSTEPDAAGWTITNAGNDVDADLAGTLAPAANRFFWIRVQIN